LIAVKCERDVNKMKYAEFMLKHIGEKFNGFVVSLSNFGIFIQLDNLVEGFCALRSLTNDVYQFNAGTNEITGKKSNQVIHLGSKVKIEVSNVDKGNKKIEFKIIEFLK
jgi:ribonuclease R